MVSIWTHNEQKKMQMEDSQRLCRNSNVRAYFELAGEGVPFLFDFRKFQGECCGAPVWEMAQPFKPNSPVFSPDPPGMSQMCNTEGLLYFELQG